MKRWTTGICKANGINIHYHRTGGEKPPVVLLHGLIMNGACWTPLAQALEEDYDVIMPDARGHENSSKPEKDYSYDNLADDVLNFIKALGIDKPILIGHSMGGMTAAVVASKKPKQLRGIVLADPAFLTPQRQQEVYESDVAAQHSQILNRSKEDFLTEMRTRNSRRSHELIELFAQARFSTSINAFEILAPPNPDYMQLIKSFNIPSLLVIGDVGAIVSPVVAAELVKLNQRLEVVQIMHAGHGIPYDQPELFANVVKTFLRSVNT